MALLKSISGFRGTIGGLAGENLTPQDIVESAAAYGCWLLRSGAPARVVIGRDARISGALVSQLVSSTLQALGIEVRDLGLSTTPTVEMAVPHLEAGGGIILTASHNPRQWNALKLLNQHGEFLSAADATDLLALAQSGQIEYATVDKLGIYVAQDGMLDYHLAEILSHPLVDAAAVRAQRYKVVVDAVNSTGALAMPALLEALGCEVEVINAEMHGDFAHNPEPLPAHLTELCTRVADTKTDLGLAVDPDVDRLALIGAGGTWIGEEYTLVTVADYVLQHRPGPTVSNLSSTRALRDITAKYGQKHYAAAVGEVNVVTKMKAVGAAIGGEGNGGIIDPQLHYGRDALVGVALVLSYMARSGKTMNELRAAYPTYSMVKDKVRLTPELPVEAKLSAIAEKYRDQAELNTIDGLKLDFPQGWVHLRRSNTEPIVRIYAEAESDAAVAELVAMVKADFV
ncbi:MAG: phosphoglucosamine mutase [Bacteroidetes bacterium]|nr:MAG: phosphoglucosamine mutase [Bacteroidota bacterium]